MKSKDPVIRDGFHVVRDRYSPPTDTAQLAPDAKRKITICNLFLNYELSINDIAKTLDETYKHVASVLIEQGIIQERRNVSREEPRLKQLSLFSSRLKNSGETDSRTAAGSASGGAHTSTKRPKK
jgi:hypothetical protein